MCVCVNMCCGQAGFRHEVSKQAAAGRLALPPRSLGDGTRNTLQEEGRTQPYLAEIRLRWQGVMSPFAGEERSACGLQLGIRPEKRLFIGSHGHHVQQHARVVGCFD